MEFHVLECLAGTGYRNLPFCSTISVIERRCWSAALRNLPQVINRQSVFQTTLLQIQLGFFKVQIFPNFFRIRELTLNHGDSYSQDVNIDTRKAR